MTGRLLLGGRWIDGAQSDPVLHKYTGTPIGSVAVASEAQVGEAIGAAHRAAPEMARRPAHRRAALLHEIARALAADRESLAQLIAQEAGKAIKFARVEVDRAVGIFTLAAEEAGRIHGETVPLDAVAAGEGCFGFWHRKPVGVVVAITPFNFPLNLVAHKVAPALAAGNTVVLKPAHLTPLTAVRLCEIAVAAGLPEGALNLVTGPGSRLGDWLVTDPRVAQITFTGSAPVGRTLLARAGIRRVTLELGNNAPVIIAADADLADAARRCALGAFYNAGQVCISTQRIYAVAGVFEEFRERLVAATRELVVGDPLAEQTDVGPMITEVEARRIEDWIAEATGAGARALVGPRREGPVHWPTVLTDTTPAMKVVHDEAFGPVVSVMPAHDVADAVRQADDSTFGLQSAIFTRDLEAVLYAMDGLNFGGLIVNDVPSFRADHMPYGGNRQSGLGREGVRYAIEEMTSRQMVVIRRRP